MHSVKAIILSTVILVSGCSARSIGEPQLSSTSSVVSGSRPGAVQIREFPIPTRRSEPTGIAADPFGAFGSPKG